jgi:hypothetical protein
MDDVSDLSRTPPAESIYLDAASLESFLGLFDLNLKTAMSQHEGIRMVKEDFHGE